MSEESKCPVTGKTSKPSRRRGHVEPGLVAEPVEPQDPSSELSPVRSHGRGVRLRRGIQDTRPGGCEEGPLCAHDRLAGLVAGRLRSLRGALHPHGLAQRRHLPHGRRPRRRGLRQPALRPAQQLARQRQPRQGAPSALAHQTEVRPQDLLGRPHDPRRQLRPRVDGLQDLRLRRRARGHLGARRGHLLGRRRRMAGHERQAQEPLLR